MDIDLRLKGNFKNYLFTI